MSSYRDVSSVPRNVAGAVLIKSEDIFLIAERDGGIPVGNQDGFGLYYHDCRMQLSGTAPNSRVQHGAVLFQQKGCEYCHEVAGSGGHRGPTLTDVSNRLTPDQLTIRIMNGGRNMPAFAGALSSSEVNDLVAFLRTRRTH